MVNYRDIREFKKTEIRKGSRVTVVVWVPDTGQAPYVHSVIIAGINHKWTADDPNRPYYGPIDDPGRDLETAFEAGFAYAEALIQ